MEHEVRSAAVTVDDPAEKAGPVETAGPAEPAGSPEAASPDADRLAGLADALAQLRDEVRAHHERAAARERVIDRLHDENAQLRAGERHLLLRPLLTDLQRLRNDLLRQADGLPAEMSGAQVADLLRSFAYSAELALERGGVSLVRPEVGAPFDPALHRAAAIVPAPGPELDATVAEVLGDGFFDGASQRVLTPAAVRVYRWRTSDEPAQQT